MPKYTLKQARNLSGLTLAEVGKKVDKTPQTVSAWENGLTALSARDFLDLCQIYRVSSDQIILPTKSSLT